MIKILDYFLDRINIPEWREQLQTLYGIDNRLDKFLAIVMKVFEIKENAVIMGVSLTELFKNDPDRLYAVIGVERKLIWKAFVSAGIRVNVKNMKDLRAWIGFSIEF